MVHFAEDLLQFGVKITKCRGFPHQLPQYDSVCIQVLLLPFLLFLCLFCCFWFLTFVESKYYSLDSADLNSGLSFIKSIKRVDCDRGVRKEPHKVLIKIEEMQIFIAGFGNENYDLESMERQIVAFATEDDSFVNLFRCE